MLDPDLQQLEDGGVMVCLTTNDALFDLVKLAGDACQVFAAEEAGLFQVIE